MDFNPVVSLTNEPINVNDIFNAIKNPTSGANSIFIGTTKDSFGGKKVLRLEYEAYKPMAIKEMEKICHEAKTKWVQLQKMVIVHRLGIVPVCEASIAIAAASEHRKEAQEVVRFVLEKVKSKVPIWKKEIYDDESVWKENIECFWLPKIS